MLELLPPEEGGDPGDPAAGMPDEHAGALAGEAHAEGGEALADCAPDDTEAIVLDASVLADAALDDPLLEELASGELLEAPRPRTDELIAELIRPPDEGPAAGA